MIQIKNAAELQKMRKACAISAAALKAGGEAIEPGITTAEIDKIIYDFIVRHGARPNFLHLYGFPATACISVNDTVIHGIPSKQQQIRPGDIVSIDTGCKIDGFNGDNACTYACGKIDLEAQRLLDVTKESLHRGIEMARGGNRVGDIGHAVQTYVEENGFSVVYGAEVTLGAVVGSPVEGMDVSFSWTSPDGDAGSGEVCELGVPTPSQSGTYGVTVTLSSDTVTSLTAEATASAELEIAKEQKDSQNIYLGELDYEALMSCVDGELRYKPLSPYAAVKRDLALVCEEKVTCGEIEDTIKKASSLITEVKLFDIYRGANLGEGKKSMAFSLTLSDPSAEISADQVERTVKKVLGNLKFKLGIEIR